MITIITPISGGKMSTNFTLEANDAAFICRENGDQEVILPNADPDAIVPPHIERLVRAIMAVDDERVIELVNNIVNDRSVQ